ncbi:MAG: hypothetical protein ACRDK4_15280 [Solirubrobacteraceae bacterium]
MSENVAYRSGRTDGFGRQGANLSTAGVLDVALGTWRCLKRCCGLVAVWLLVGGLLAGAAQARSEIKWYWPQGTTENCWQTGAVGAESAACDQVGPGFLSAPGGHTPGFAHLVDFINYAGAETPELSPSGDYCDYYGIGGYIDQPEASDQSKYTGLVTPQPYSSYQESDGHQNTCVAEGHAWAGELRSNAPESRCYYQCSIMHAVSFHDQGLNDRPWSSTTGEPTFVVSDNVRAWTFGWTTKNAGAWGFLCPEFQDSTTGAVVEYCIETWRGPYNPEPASSEEKVSECKSWGSHPFDSLTTFFYAGTKWATLYPGSASTFVFPHGESWSHFEAGITEANFRAAIAAVEATCGVKPSSKPADWALVSVENGTEAWREFTEAGGAVSNLSMRTEYTPRPAPSVTTLPATEITGTQVRLNGSVNPNGQDTHYYFQYGTSASYGSSTGEADAGSGTSVVPVSSGVSNLESGTTYHCRLVAYNVGGPSYGVDQTFTTSTKRANPSWAELDPVTRTQTVYFRGKEGAMVMWELKNGSTWEENHLGGEVAAGSSPTTIRTELWGKEFDWVFYVDSKTNHIADLYFNGLTGKWEQAVVGKEEVATGFSPAVIRETEGATEALWVYFGSKSTGGIAYSYWNPGSEKWEDEYPGEQTASGTSPASVRAEAGGKEYDWTYYVTAKTNHIAYRLFNGGTGSWESGHLGGEVAAGSSPTAIHGEWSGKGYDWVYYVDAKTHHVALWYFNALIGKWENFVYSTDEVAAGSSPTAVRWIEGTHESMAVYFADKNTGGLTERYSNGSTWEENHL